VDRTDQAAVTILRPQVITAEAWAPFGWLPVADTDPADGTHTLEYQWTDPHLNLIAHAADEVEWVPEGAVVARMYRHDTHTQALMSVNCPGIIAVAAADMEFGQAGDLSAIRAFVVEPLDAFVLHRGSWHWGPFPVGDEPIRLLNVQGRRYAEDNASVDIAALGPVVAAVP